MIYLKLDITHLDDYRRVWYIKKYKREARHDRLPIRLCMEGENDERQGIL